MLKNVIPLGNITKLDIPADQMLKQTLGKLTDVVIIGYDRKGKEYFISSMADGGDVVWLLERCKKQLLEIDGDDYA